jgi:hypothetical protein
VFWVWFFVGPALLLAIWTLRDERTRARFVSERLGPDPHLEPGPGTVIVAVDGPRDGLRERLKALASLDYPDYELIVAARSAGDIPPAVLPHKAIVVLTGAKRRAENVDTLLGGVRMARKRSQFFAFAASDCVVSKNWLAALSRPLAEPAVGASTGFRWYAPEPPGFWPLMRSVWNASIAGLLGPGDNPFAWEGAMAVRKNTFFELRQHDLWKTALSPGAALATAVHQAGLTVAFAPGAMVACTAGTGIVNFFARARSEMIVARRCYPRLWSEALVSHFFYCGAMAAAIAASLKGSRGAEWALVAQLGLGMLKGLNRAILAKAELSGREAWFERHAWVHALWTPPATWIWLGVLLSSALVAAPFRRAKRHTLTRALREDA